MNQALLSPVCAMVLLTFLVWIWMYYLRLGKIMASGKDPQILADEAKAQALLKDVVNPSDNFENLFEMPVLFYAAVFAVISAGIGDEGFVALAWAFVALRGIHSLVHCTYNRIVHRFAAYVLSSFVLWGMWARIGLKICCPH